MHEHGSDAWFAARWLGRSRREAAHATFAFLHQLHEVLCDAGCTEQTCGCGPTSERLRVAQAILDHVWRGEPTGRADLDAFAPAAQAFGLERAWFERAIEAMAQPLPPRVATWRRLREHVEALTIPLASIGAALLGAGEASPQLVALGTAMRVTRLLERVPDDARAGRVVLPLDDLTRHGLTDREVLQLTSPDDRWRALASFEASRVATLFDGGAKAITAIPDADCRRAASVLIELERMRLARCAQALATLSAPQASTLRGRLATLPRAIRATMKGTTP
jgi:phytoene synthase